MKELMHALVKESAAPGLKLCKIPVPAYGPQDLLIKIVKTSICGTDVHIYDWDQWSQEHVTVGINTGHEYCGVVVAKGDLVEGFEIGQRVTGEGHLTCGVCRNCRAGQRHLCSNTKGVGVERPGAFAEYLSLPACNAVPLPDSVPDEIAAIFDPFGNAVHTALKFGLLGEDVLITGAGPIGAMAAKVARYAGARHVVITDFNTYRLDLAKKLEPDIVTVDLNRQNIKEVAKTLDMHEGFDVGLEMSGSGAALKDMMDAMINGGKLALLGTHPRAVETYWNTVIFKALTIKGIYGREMFETWYKMIAMVQSGLDLSPIITHRLDFRDWETGMKAMKSGQAGKVVLDWTTADQD